MKRKREFNMNMNNNVTTGRQYRISTIVGHNEHGHVLYKLGFYRTSKPTDKESNDEAEIYVARSPMEIASASLAVSARSCLISGLMVHLEKMSALRLSLPSSSTISREQSRK